MKLNPILYPFMILVVILPTTGCKEDKDDRLVRMSERHEQRQAEQTQQANQLHREVTAMQREVQAERTAIGQQRDKLETDRRTLARERRFDSLTAAAIGNASLWLACLLPLAIAWLLLRQPDSPADEQAIVEVMLEDLVSDKPLLLTRPQNDNTVVPRIRDQSVHNESD